MLELLQKRGTGNNICELLNHSFAEERAVLRQAGAYSEVFQTTRGVKQGDVASPILFNIVMDCILREFMQRAEPHLARLSCGTAELQLTPLFYADDGVFFATNSDALQAQLDLFSRLCAGFELEINADKTKVCTYAYPVTHVNISAEANIRRYHESVLRGEANDITCAFCDEVVASGEFLNHLKSDSCLERQGRGLCLAGQSDRIALTTALLRFLEAQTAQNPNYPHQVSQYAISRIPLNGMYSPLVARDFMGRALVYAETDATIVCPFGCATRCRARTGLCGHAIEKHSDQVLILPRRKFARDLYPHFACGRCDAAFDNASKAEKHRRAHSCVRRADRAHLQDELTQRQNQIHPLVLDEREIEDVSAFKYLGRIFTSKDSDMPAIFRSIKAAKVRWHQLGKILRQKSMKNHCKRILISVIIHSSLLFGCESWTSDARKLSLLRTVQQRILRSTFGIYRRDATRNELGYMYPSRAHVLTTAKVEDIATIFRRRRLGFYIRALSRKGEHLALRKWIEALNNLGLKPHTASVVDSSIT